MSCLSYFKLNLTDLLFCTIHLPPSPPPAPPSPYPLRFPCIYLLPTLSSVYLPAHRILRASEYMLLRECV